MRCAGVVPYRAHCEACLTWPDACCWQAVFAFAHFSLLHSWVLTVCIFLLALSLPSLSPGAMGTLTDASSEFRTFEYLFDVQKALSSTTDKRQTDGTSTTTTATANPRIAAYIRWHLNNRIEQSEEEIGSLKKVSPFAKAKLADPTTLCACCNSVLSHYRSIPKKLKQRKHPKKGTNTLTTLVSARCQFCRKRARFTGIKKTPLNVPVGVVKKAKSRPIQSGPSSSTTTNTTTTPATTSYRTSTSNKPNSRKASFAGLKTPTSAISHKEALQKLLSDSKKQRTLDSKTRLSDFLGGCFK